MPTRSHLVTTAIAGLIVTLPPALSSGLTAQEQRLVIEAGGHDVSALIDAAARLLHRNYVVQPAMQNQKPVAVWVASPFKFSLY